MKTSMLKTKELRVFYRKFANERVHSLQKIRNYTLIAAIIVLVSTIFFKSYISSTVNFGLLIGFLPFVSVVLTIQIFLMQRSCTFSRKDLERAIKEVESEFEIKKSKRKNINITTLENNVHTQLKHFEALSKEKKELEIQEKIEILSSEDKDRLIILEDDVLLAEKALDSKEFNLQVGNEIIRLEEIEDKEHAASMEAAQKFIKDHFDVTPVTYAVRTPKVSCS